MNTKRVITTLLVIVTIITVTGCGQTSSISHENYSDYAASNGYESNNYDSSNNSYNSDDTNTTREFHLKDPDGYSVELRGNVRFVPVEKETIYAKGYAYMYTLVDLETGNTYLYTVYSDDGGSMTPLTNSDGTPCVYEDCRFWDKDRCTV